MAETTSKKYFTAEDLFANQPELLKFFGQEAKCHIDNRIPICLGHLRDHFDSKISIIEGYALTEVPSYTSEGKAVRFNIQNISPLEVKRYIVENWKANKLLQIIRAMEDYEGMDHVYFDVRNVKSFTFFAPPGKQVSDDFYSFVVKSRILA